MSIRPIKASSHRIWNPSLTLLALGLVFFLIALGQCRLAMGGEAWRAYRETVHSISPTCFTVPLILATTAHIAYFPPFSGGGAHWTPTTSPIAVRDRRGHRRRPESGSSEVDASPSPALGSGDRAQSRLPSGLALSGRATQSGMVREDHQMDAIGAYLRRACRRDHGADSSRRSPAGSPRRITPWARSSAFGFLREALMNTGVPTRPCSRPRSSCGRQAEQDIRGRHCQRRKSRELPATRYGAGTPLGTSRPWNL